MKNLLLLRIIVLSLRIYVSAIWHEYRFGSDLINTDINGETQYNALKLAATVTRNIPLMNEYFTD